MGNRMHEVWQIVKETDSGTWRLILESLSFTKQKFEDYTSYPGNMKEECLNEVRNAKRTIQALERKGRMK